MINVSETENIHRINSLLFIQLSRLALNRSLFLCLSHYVFTSRIAWIMALYVSFSRSPVKGGVAPSAKAFSITSIISSNFSSEKAPASGELKQVTSEQN